MFHKLLLYITMITLTIWGCGEGNTPDISADQQRALANELDNRELYPQAIEEYKIYLEQYSISPEMRANILFTIAGIYFERLRDYQNAMAYYIRVKNLYPGSKIINEVNKQIIACLERMDKSSDAAQALREATNLDKSQVPENKPGEVVAVIGDRKITQGDLDLELDRTLKRIPPQMRPKDLSRDQKIDFLKQFLTIELLYNTAKRKGLDKEKEIIDGTFEAKKMLMAEMLRQQELSDKVKVANTDIELYYEKHKDEFTEKDKDGKVKRQKTLQEAQEEVARKVQSEKENEAMN
ncbi:MAG: hypothetical protein M1426_02395, partial [Patescibacteria group bacterium]|nr:hypothetical protein [Patescibacteria group bacterium]